MKSDVAERQPVALTDQEACLRDVIFHELYYAGRLREVHVEELLRRGLSSVSIDKAEYFSVDYVENQTVDNLYDQYGEWLLKVPGFFRGGLIGPHFLPSRGLFIPVRDDQWRIISGQIRTGWEPKYLTLSGSASHVHIPVWVTPGETVWVTEGPLKADVASALSNLPIVGIPGVACWKYLLPLLRRWQTRRVVVAFDSDKNRRGAVWEQERSFIKSLADVGYEVDIAEWKEEQGKGLDDLFAAGFQPTLREVHHGN